MRRIKTLDEITASKIAAGEVVERPSAVVKELFENSVDAGSTEIIVEIEGGGKDLIRVADNGSGIPREDILLAFERHSTSKIDGIGDVYALHTMGFRGEALASIAAVSRVKLITKTADDSCGYAVEARGGSISEITETAANTGTTMEVTDLFFNTPVRWKFLKTTTQETRSCFEIMNKLALANHHVSITFISDGHLVFKTDGKSDLFATVHAIYGRTIANELLEIPKAQSAGSEIKVWGLISKFTLRRNNRNLIMTFVNGRYVKHSELNGVIEGNYRAHLMPREFPVCFVFIEVPPHTIDVNVHPAKTEIKFEEFQPIHTAVGSAIKRVLNLHSHIPSVPLPNKGEMVQDEREISRSISSYSHTSFTNAPSTETHSIKVESAPDGDFLRGAHTWFEPKEDQTSWYSQNSSSPILSREPDIPFGKPYSTLPHSNQQQEKRSPVQESIPCMHSISEPLQTQEHQISDGGHPQDRSTELSEMRVIGFFNATYLLGEYNNTLYLVDQHAAHEKILYEEFVDAVRASQVYSQVLLIPFEVAIEREILEEIDFEQVGFSVKRIHPFALEVSAIPATMNESIARAFLRAYIDQAGEVEDPLDLATRACKAAIKGGDVLLDIEGAELLKRLAKIRDPYNCPHGRPTIVKLTRYQLDRMFKRIL